MGVQHLCKLAVIAALVGHAGVAVSQSRYPSKPITVISPLGAGGAVEIVGRIVTQKMADSMGQQFVVDARLGAGGSIGHEYVARAPADGYTILLSGSGYCILPWVYPIKYDPRKDLVPVSQMTLNANLLIVPASFQGTKVSDLISMAKAKPGSINFSSTGVGSYVHFATEMLALAAGVKLTHVAYKSAAQSYADLISGELQMIMSSTISAIPHVKTGRVKALGVSSLQRLASLPDIPTIAESGVPGFSALPWTGIFAPGKVPQDILMRLNAEVIKAVNQPDFLKRVEAEGGLPIQSLDQFRKTIEEELAVNQRIARDNNIKAE